MLDCDRLNGLSDITRIQAADRPNAAAMVFEKQTTSFAELDARASRVANGLIALGVRPQTRIGYIGLNSDRFFEVLFGAFKANAVLVGVNWRLAPPETVFVVNDSEAEVLFVGDEFAPLIDQVRGELETVRHVIGVDNAHGTWLDYATWRDGQSSVDPNLPIHPEDDVIQIYTSGTTGHPKGVQLTNANCLTFLQTAEKIGWRYDERDVTLVAMPNFHVAGLNMGLVSFAHGAKAIILKLVDPVQMIEAIERCRITSGVLVPAVIQLILATPGVEARDFSSLRSIYYGASPISEEVLTRARVILGAGFTQLYGMTETTSGGTYLAPHAHEGARLRSCGLPYPGFEIKVIDDGGAEVAPGAVGEIVIRSKTVMKAYWKNPEATARAIVDGWFHTGDAGYFDRDGYLYIHDRVKDMIVSGGENVYPAEVENALMSHPAVADAAVIGVPDDKWGEAVKAIVVLKTGAATSAGDVIAFCRTRIAGYKIPKSVDFVAALPRNTTGKILRRDLREPYWAGKARRVN